MKNLIKIAGIAGVLFFIALAISCKSEKEKYSDRFYKDYEALVSLKSDIYKLLDERKELDDARIFFILTPDPKKEKLPTCLYNEKLAKQMKKLAITEVKCMTMGLKECGYFGEIDFLLNLKKTQTGEEEIYFKYKKCDTIVETSQKDYQQYKLEKNWGLVINRN